MEREKLFSVLESLCARPSQEIERALIRLYHPTGKRKHLDLAIYFITERGKQQHYFDEEARRRGEDPEDVCQERRIHQSHMPMREQTKIVGHAVRASRCIAGRTAAPARCWCGFRNRSLHHI